MFEKHYPLIDRVFQSKPTTYLYGGLICNVDLTAREVDTIPTVEFLKWDGYHIGQVIDRLAAKDPTPYVLNPRYVDVFVTVLGDEQFNRKAGIYANEQMIIDQLIERSQPCTSQNVSQIICDLWDSLADNSTWTAASQAQSQRAAQISEMTRGGQHGFMVMRNGIKYSYAKNGQRFDPNKGMATGGSRSLKGAWSASESKSFEEMTDKEVDDLYAEYAETKRFQAMTPQQLKDYVNSNRNANHRSSLQLPNVVQPEPQAVLINPETVTPTDPGREFTQRELISYINAEPYNGRNLITRNGRTVPALRKRFEQIIQGKLR